MRHSIFASGLLAVSLLVSVTATAQPKHVPAKPAATPKKLGSFEDWTAATHQEGGQLVCYAFTRAHNSTPTVPGRSEVVLTVTERPGGRDAVALSAGFAFAPGAEVTMQVDQASHTLYTSGRSAFARDGATLVAAMQKGRGVVARSPEPNKTQVVDNLQPQGLFPGLRRHRQGVPGAQMTSSPIQARDADDLTGAERLRILAKTARFDPPAAKLADGRRELVGLSREELLFELAAIGEKPFRAKQIWHWIYHQGATDFFRMSSIARPLQEKLAEYFVIGRPEAALVQTSTDETRKFLFRFRDGQEAETVYIPDRQEDRGAVCISSQVGCTLSCRFCHTGTQTLVRNLGAAEIVGQFMAARDSYGECRAQRAKPRGCCRPSC